MTNIHAFSEALYESRDTMRGVAGGLAHLAGAFMMTGNAKVAEELYDLCNVLDKQVDRLMSAYSQKVNDDMRASEQATATMLLGIAGGMKVAGGLSPESEDVMFALAESVSPGITIPIREAV
ncbi:hypothetical protein HOU02_gp375 [Caulobacter phage CcrBL9]|uniref:Uncharacterized protein n=1 Tax=Caulobacter phage CcrBL9 TaxID=2283270 RepID=A0A385ECG7_9CAUD|nr:hypothetical protein HOU02_gp375 [Caulobacter phage CcrBL9]AXQ69350.1 hypothetical protein CcrBL9_gp326 [Caulobacter phage CcrBL9]